MRPATSLVVGLLLMLPLAVCVDVSQYLETGETVTLEETIISDGSVYTLIFVDDEATLLLRGDGSIVTDEEEISRALLNHYSSLYYPSQGEINALRNDFEEYDASRDNGDFYPGTILSLPGLDKKVGMEEAACRYSLFLYVFPCTNSTNCIYSAMMLCDEYGDALGCGDPARDLQPHVEQFSFAGNHLTEGLERIYELLDGLSTQNIYASLTEIKEIMADFDEYEEDIETTKFRLPQGGETCRDCFGLCPRIIINESFLASAESKIDTMLEDVAMLGDYDEQGARMAGEGEARIEMARLNVERAYYHSFYDSQRERAQDAVEKARALLVVVANSSMQSYADRADELIAEIDADLDAGEFSDVNASIAELTAKTYLIEGSIDSQWEIYNETEKAEAEASLSLFILETSGLSEEQETAVDALSARKEALDRAFVSGLSPERYIELGEDYQEIIDAANPMVQNVEQGTAYMSPFKAAARKTNEGLENLAVAIQPMDRSDKSQLSEYAPLMLSAVSFFSLASLLTFAFLFVFAGITRFTRRRSVMFFGFLLLGIGLVVVGLVSAGAYFTFKSSSSEADFNDFRSSIAAADEVSVIVETNGVSAGAVSDMKECAGKIAGYLSPRDVQIYEKTDGDCITPAGGTLGECYNSVAEPIITLRYTAVQTRPEFSVVFVDSAVFAGDEQYFSECEFAVMLQAEPEYSLEEEAEEAVSEEGGGEWVIE